MLPQMDRVVSCDPETRGRPLDHSDDLAVDLTLLIEYPATERPTGNFSRRFNESDVESAITHDEYELARIPAIAQALCICGCGRDATSFYGDGYNKRCRDLLWANSQVKR